MSNLWSRKSISASRNFRYLWNPKIHDRVKKMFNIGYLLCQLNPLRNFEIHFFTINFNNIIQLLSRSLKSLDFPNKILYYFTISPIQATCSFCDVSNNKVKGKNGKVPHLIIFSSFLLSRTRRFQHVFLKNPQCVVALREKGQASLLHKTPSK